MTMPTTRPLTTADAEAYTRLRREMLENAPWAFAASAEDDVGLNLEHVTAQIAKPFFAILGAFDGAGTLVASATLTRLPHRKMAHRAYIWGVYVTPEFRGRGVGEAVMRAAVEIARTWDGVNSVGLSVSANSSAAARLYERLGFRTWGVEPGALILDGRAYDERHMVLCFEPS